MSPMCRTVYECLCRRHPQRAVDLSREVHLHLTTVLYHLRRLHKLRLVIRRRGHWAPAGAMRGVQDARLAAGPAGQRLLRLLEERGPMDQGQAALLLDVSPSAVSALVQRMAPLGLLRTRREGRRKVLEVPPGEETGSAGAA